MEYKLELTKAYIWIPVKVESKKEIITFKSNDQKILEFNIPIMQDNEFDYYAPINVEQYKGSILMLEGDMNEEFIQKIRIEDCSPKYKVEERPQIHYTAQKGWINDPNGLVYHDGIYHMYYQYNPFDTEWDNMSWGHATSKDLIHWEQEDTVLWPDENGMMFSGCGINNEGGLLGLNEDTIVYYYSTAGDSTPWSKGKDFTQRIAYSIDGGKNLIKIKDISIDTIEKENRDPKVFWHEESNNYIMVLWLKEDEFAILRSEDMKQYTITQRIRFEKAFECPDLFCLEVDGNSSDKKWVFWCADGFYYIGDFDGYTFTNVSERKVAYTSSLPYAAQTISGVKGRIITIPWLRAKFENRFYTGAMGLPRELSLVISPQGLLLQQKLCKEYEEMKQFLYTIEVLEKLDKQVGTTLTECIENVAGALEIEFCFLDGGSDKLVINLGSNDLIIDLGNHMISFMEQTYEIPYCFSLESLNIIIDHGIVELTAKQGIIYLVFEIPNYENPDSYYIHYEKDNKLKKINIFGLEMRK